MESSIATVPQQCDGIQDRAASSSSSSSSSSSASCSSSPILQFVFFHKAIRAELKLLHADAVALQKGGKQELEALRNRYEFFRLVYAQHSNAEDEVIFPAFNRRVKNIAQAYSLEHKDENNIFSYLLELLNSASGSGEFSAKLKREILCCTEAIQTILCQHMFKEEEQVFPLLMQHFSSDEQASLVWQFFCSIPVDLLHKFLPWLSFSLSDAECEEMIACMHKIVPNEELLQQVIFSWLKPGLVSQHRECSKVETHEGSQVTQAKHAKNLGERNLGRKRSKGTATSSHLSKAVNQESGVWTMFPIDEILYWHEAIRHELRKFAKEIRKLLVPTVSDLSLLSDKLQFLAEVYSFHSTAEDNIIFPAVSKRANHLISYVSDHTEEELWLNKLRGELDGVCSLANGSSGKIECIQKLCAEADHILEVVQQHLLEEEEVVLPLARKHCSIKEQRSLLYQSLRIMPLRLLEKVLPWLVALCSIDEARCMLHNVQLAAPENDKTLVILLMGWACKGKTCIAEGLGEFNFSTCNGTSSKTRSVRMKCELAPDGQIQVCCVPGLGIKEVNLTPGSGNAPLRPLSPSSAYSGSGVFGMVCVSQSYRGLTAKPIDTIFQFHKALRKDLEYLDLESGNLVDCDREFLKQFTGRFMLLWGLYRAHSNAEDEIVFPALEAKEALHNVSHSYSIDHKQEEQLFKDISIVLSDLSGFYERLPPKRCDGSQSHMIEEDVTPCQEKLMHKELAAKLQGMCRSIRVALDSHVSREELELWPLFDVHFSVQEQDKIIGHIIGSTGAEVLQSMIPWVTSALTEEEQDSMFDTFLQATRNTMFDKWLSACFPSSPIKSPQSSTSEVNEKPESGSIEGLKMVADYLSKGWNCENMKKSCPDASLGDKEMKVAFCDTPIQENNSPKKVIDNLGNTEKGHCTAQSPMCIEHQYTCREDEESSLDQVQQGMEMFKPGWQDIFRMNQKELEAALRKVSSDASLDPRQKAYLMQNLMTSRWIVDQQKPLRTVTPKDTSDKYIHDFSPSFHDTERRIYGCKHYKRNCKLIAACCGRLFTCRLCHDEASDHTMDRQATKEMMCMKCLKVQPVSQYCTTASCNNLQMARYYCSICKFFDDDKRDIYHCPSCNICRVGKGLGIDFFHCMVCNACMSVSLKTHKCHEKGLESNCPICHEFMFTSKAPVKALACGHLMHSSCFQAYTRSHYTCPICCKSLGDMSVYFGMLDALLAGEQLPEEYRDREQHILCSDCEQKSTAPFHWLYHKCQKCGSYNTRVL